MAILRRAVEEAGFFVDDEADRRQAREREARRQKKRLIACAALTIPLFCLSMGPMVLGVTLPVPPLVLAVVQLLLATPVMVICHDFYTDGVRSLLRGRPNMNALITMGTLASYAYSLWALVQIAMGNEQAVHQLYFESTAVILTLVLLGKTLEMRAKGKSGSAIEKLMGLTPKTGSVLREGEEVEIPVAEIAVGDIVCVRPGERVPVDGVITEGETAMDESMLTGESMPVDKRAGDRVSGGSINKHGYFRFDGKPCGARHRAGADYPPGRGGAGLQSAHRAAGRSHCGGICSRGAGHRAGDAGRVDSRGRAVRPTRSRRRFRCW